MSNNSYPFASAVRTFWSQLSSQGLKQAQSDRADYGNRRNVTGGKQMDGFIDVIKTYLLTVGVPRTDIHIGKSLEDLPEYLKPILPGYYRPTKTFDMLVIRDGQLRIVLELKSQVGPSFGNNFNNRVEEAIGSASDLWVAYREGAFGTHSPWLGYLMLLEDSPTSTRPIKIASPHYKYFSEFEATSYAQRYQLLCRKLLLERLYSGATFIMSKREDVEKEQNYIEPAEDLSVAGFLAELVKAAI